MFSVCFQSCRMAHQQNGLFLQSLLKAFSVLIFHILLKDVCHGQPQLIGPSQVLVARAGDDVILPCHLEPASDVSAKTLEWTRSSLEPRFVYVSRGGQEIEILKNPSFKGRTSLFVDELKYGNISLKISKVKFDDIGTYTCYIPELKKEAFVKLVVASDAATSPVISLSGIDKNRGGVVLQCESSGWYPEPELLWLDGEGNLLSAGPTETLRGPDDLYTVSSRVTVEKRHSNNITCRLQQRNTNQSRETHIHVPEDFFEIPSSSPSLIIGLVVSLALCIMLLILSAVVLLLRKRKHMMKTNRRAKDQTDSGDVQVPLRKTERELLNTSNSSTKTKKQTSCLSGNISQAQEEKQKMDSEMERLRNELDSTKQQLSGNISQAQEEKQKMKRPRNELDSTKQQLQQEKQAAENLKKQLGEKTREMIKSEIEKNEFIQKLTQTLLTLDSKLSESISQQTESEKKSEINNQLQEVKQTSEKLKNQLENKNPEIIVSENEKDEIFQTLMKTFPTLESKLSGNKSQAQEDKQKMERLRNELDSTKQQLQQEKQAAENLKKQLGEKNRELSGNISQAQEEKQKMERLRNELDSTKQQLSGNISQAQEEKQKMERLNTELDSTKQQKGDIILEEVNGHGHYICLRNTSSEDKMMTGWELKLIKDRELFTYKFQENFTLKAGEGLTLHRFSSTRRPYPDNTHLTWKDMSIWNSEDKVKISLISNTGEEHRLQ
uniref:Ig-like domain-containing protein n=1 Tax=Oreochromis niloticus TaxID=8128 RepID=A0A669BAN4_ORENI